MNILHRPAAVRHPEGPVRFPECLDLYPRSAAPVPDDAPRFGLIRDGDGSPHRGLTFASRPAVAAWLRIQPDAILIGLLVAGYTLRAIHSAEPFADQLVNAVGTIARPPAEGGAR